MSMAGDELDPRVRARYAEMPADGPPQSLDDAIRAAARRAVKAVPQPTPSAKLRKPRPAWWSFAAAATLAALTVGIVEMLPRDESPDLASSAPPPAPGAPPPAREAAPPDLVTNAPPAVATERQEQAGAKSPVPAKLRPAPAKPPAAMPRSAPTQMAANAPTTNVARGAPSESPTPVEESASAAKPTRDDNARVAQAADAAAPAPIANATQEKRAATASKKIAAAAGPPASLDELTRAPALQPYTVIAPPLIARAMPQSFESRVKEIGELVERRRDEDARRALMRLRDDFPDRVKDLPPELLRLLPRR